MITIAEIKTEDGRILGVLMMREKAFKTGSRGFYGNGKIEIGGRGDQTQVQLVEIGSRGAPAPDQGAQGAKISPPPPSSMPKPPRKRRGR